MHGATSNFLISAVVSSSAAWILHVAAERKNFESADERTEGGSRLFRWTQMGLALIVSALVSAAALTAVSFALTASPPWGGWRTYLQPWVPQIAPYAVVFSAICSWIALRLLRRDWSPEHVLPKPRAPFAAYCIAIALGVVGAASFGAGNEVFKGSYPEPPSLFAYTGDSVTGVDFEATVKNGSVDFPSGGIDVTLRMQGAPSSDLEFLLLGNEYFAESDFTSVDEGVERYGRGAFLPGNTSREGCSPLEGAEASEWKDPSSVYLPIRGAARSDANGNAVATISFTDERKWYTAHGPSTAVHLPRLQINTQWTEDCQIGLQGYGGNWFKPRVAKISMALSSRSDDRTTNITHLIPNDFVFETDGNVLPSLEPSDLHWEEEMRDGEYLFLLAGYEVDSPQTRARAQALLFGSALFLGLALTAVFQAIISSLPEKQVLLPESPVRSENTSPASSTASRPARLKAGAVALIAVALWRGSRRRKDGK